MADFAGIASAARPAYTGPSAPPQAREPWFDDPEDDLPEESAPSSPRGISLQQLLDESRLILEDGF